MTDAERAEAHRMENDRWERYDREQALLKAGAQLSGLEWPPLDMDAPTSETCVEPLRDFLQRIWNPLHAMTCHVDAPGLTERLPELGTVVPKTAALGAETSTAAPAPAGVFAMASTTHKLGGWGA